jgi:hypothetical protein
MEVFKKTIGTLFSGDRRYVIPLFQRPYVWSKERQWEPLWDDIVGNAELELSRREDQPEPLPHFLGAIVTQQRRSWGDELLAHDVIDGQQRLTTFQLLLNAFRDFALEQGDQAVSTWASGLVRNTNPIADPETEQFKLWPTARDIDQFRFVSTAGSRAKLDAAHPVVIKRRRVQPRPRMIDAYAYFHDCIQEWVNAKDPSSAGSRLKALKRTLERRIHLVSIELDSNEDPQAIFETLNARGVPLLASDLLRNYIFQRAGQPGLAEKLHAAYWHRFEIPENEQSPEGARFWEVEERQGRLSRARLDLFVQHFLSMKTGTEVLSGQLFPAYKAWIERSKPYSSVEEELRDLIRFSDHFYSLLRPDETTPVGRFASRLRTIDTSTAYPLILGLLGNNRIGSSERLGIFADIESFLVRRLVCGRSTKNYNRLFLQLLRELEKDDCSRASFQALLAAGTGEAVDWPNDADFERGWSTVDAYKELKAHRCEMILRAIDDALKTSKNEKISLEQRLSVEHVLPQEWQEHWPLPVALDATVAAEEREDLVHDFGNLTLLTQSLNSSVSNGPADRKLPEIAAQSALRLNSSFQGRTTWTEANVRERSHGLFQTALKIWPRP